jgi:hypothetical protein
MRIVLIAAGDATANPRIMALAASLRSVGHDMTVVCGGSAPAGPGVVRVPTRVPVGGGAAGGMLRRAQPASMRQGSFERRLVAAASDLDPKLVYAANEAAVPLAVAVAEATGAAVVSDPRHRDAGTRDVIHLAPDRAEFFESPAGPGLPFHTTKDDRDAWTPQPGRYEGRKIVIAYRPTETTPARALHAALDRAGFAVQHSGDQLDWAEVDPDAEAVVFVESPYPALDITGTNPGVPVLLWAHHGEHHTDTHLRLIARYGVDAVLLAHSWHLAHRYPVPVHRFPFAVDPELLDGSRPWTDRRLDVAFVGAAAAPYAERRRMIEALETALPPDRLSIADGVTPEELAADYGDARIVFNDGGTRHHPITMRVFEAVGSGAGLLTEDAPGLQLLFTPVEHYRELRPESIVATVNELLADPGTADMAEAAYHHAGGRHTYDHRVDELIAIAAATSPAAPRAPEAPASEIAAAIADDVEVMTVAAYGLPDLAAELPLHAVWIDPAPGTRGYDAVAIGSDRHETVAAARGDAVRYLYIEPGTPMPPELSSFQSDTGLTRIDLEAPGYRVDAEDVT